MNDLLQQTLAEVASLATQLSKQAAKSDGKVPQLVVAQAVVRADQLRNALRKLSDRLAAATPKEGTRP